MPDEIDPELARAFFAAERLDQVDPRRQVTWRIGDAMRAITDRLVATTSPQAELEAILADLEAAAERLGRFDFGRRYEGYAEAALAGTSDDPEEGDRGSDGPPAGHADFSPVIGRANPLAPPVELDVEGDRVIGTVTFGHAYEGPPGHVHGGWVAAAFDEVLGAVQAMSGNPGMTAHLEIDYKRPTPLHVPLRFEAWIDRVEGRKIFCTCHLFSADAGDPGGEEHLRAESRGLFISIDFSKIAALTSQRDSSD
ncbi:MAG: PaaI family thioesterase [Acidimicrobiales bacterium]